MWRHPLATCVSFLPTQLSWTGLVFTQPYPAPSLAPTPAPALRPQSYLLVLVLPRVVFLQPVCQGPVLEGTGHPVLHLDLAQRLGIGDHLHHPCERRRGCGTPEQSQGDYGDRTTGALLDASLSVKPWDIWTKSDNRGERIAGEAVPFPSRIFHAGTLGLLVSLVHRCSSFFVSNFY